MEIFSGDVFSWVYFNRKRNRGFKNPKSNKSNINKNSSESIGHSLNKYVVFFVNWQVGKTFVRKKQKERKRKRKHLHHQIVVVAAQLDARPHQHIFCRFFFFFFFLCRFFFSFLFFFCFDDDEDDAPDGDVTKSVKHLQNVHTKKSCLQREFSLRD